MSEAPKVPTPPPTPAPKPDATFNPGVAHTPLSEEFDRAKWTLPPLPIFGVALAIVGVVVAVLMYANRYQPAVSGTVSDVFAVEQAGGEAVLLTTHVTITNDTDKQLYIKNIKGELNANNATRTDDAASPSDFGRYFSGYPDLRSHAGDPLRNETKIAPHQAASGTVVLGFPVTKAQFDARQQLRIIIVPYDQREVPLSEKK